MVEDSKPFRKYISSTLGEKKELQIVGEIADGLEAVERAEELKPDLIMLDIGLPSLNGIDAARRIREVSPQSKILFLSQESSAAVAQKGLDLGALGYVVKAHAGNELLIAVETVVRGQQFLSRGLEGRVASITYRIDADKKLIHTKCIGLVTVDQVVDHFRELEQDPMCPDHLDVFLDLRETTSLPLDGQLAAVSDAIARIQKKVAFRICAIVTGGDELFARMRILEGLTQQSFRKITVFRVAADAEQWLTLQRMSYQ